jgi:DNA-binding Xre family transcriptional regulator
MNPEQLAKVSNISLRRINRLFRDNDMTLVELKSILKALQMTMDDFLLYRPNRKP